MKNNCNWHTKRKYDECFAKLILEEYFSDRYGDLQLQDKPDLFDVENNIGIEVVLAVDEKRNEAMTLWAKIPEKNPQQQKRAIERMKQLGEEYQGGVQCWSSVEYPYDLSRSPLQLFVKALVKKANLLNKNQYKECDRYDLFVNSSIYIQPELLSELFEQIKSINNKGKKYSFIYFYWQKTIVEFDFIHNKYSVSNDEKQAELVKHARELVYVGELE